MEVSPLEAASCARGLAALTRAVEDRVTAALAASISYLAAQARAPAWAPGSSAVSATARLKLACLSLLKSGRALPAIDPLENRRVPQQPTCKSRAGGPHAGGGAAQGGLSAKGGGRGGAGAGAAHGRGAAGHGAAARRRPRRHRQPARRQPLLLPRPGAVHNFFQLVRDKREALDLCSYCASVQQQD